MKYRSLWLASLATMVLLTAVIHTASFRVALAQEAIEGSDPDETLKTVVSFTHGVASSDVRPDSALLWTRINQTATITAEVATDATFNTVVFTQPVTVTAGTDFTARVSASPLTPSQTYYFRWHSPAAASIVGQFVTAPSPDEEASVRFAFTGDSDGTTVLGIPVYNQFETLDAARLDGIDFFVYLGDTIYSDSQFRLSGPATTLDEYRDTYKANREIEALPNLLAATSTYAIWDDHEVQNDFDGQTVDPNRYSNGRQAFLEYMPIGDAGLPSDSTCADDPLFRVFSWGRDVDIIVLDERSCRSPDAAGACPFIPIFDVPDLAPTLPSDLRMQAGLPADPPAGCLETINNPNRTMLGPVQKQLFKDTLMASTAKFKFVINELAIQQFYTLPYDRWEGYAAERAEILDFIRDNQIDNVIFLTADAHANLINEVFIDNFVDPQPIAQEFVTGPIATTTLQGAINLLPIPGALDIVNDILDVVGVDCRHLDADSYGLVEVNAGSDSVTVTLKNDVGTPLTDQQNPGVTCIQTLTASDLKPGIYLPAVQNQ